MEIYRSGFYVIRYEVDSAKTIHVYIKSTDSGITYVRPLSPMKLPKDAKVHLTECFKNHSNLRFINAIVDNFPMDKVVDTSGMFEGCTNLGKYLVNYEGRMSLGYLENLNTSNVTNMDYMFRDCRRIRNLEFIRKWDTGNVTSMRYMFYGCRGLRDVAYIGALDTRKVQSMNHMFGFTHLLANRILEHLQFNECNCGNILAYPLRFPPQTLNNYNLIPYRLGPAPAAVIIERRWREAQERRQRAEQERIAGARERRNAEQAEQRRIPPENIVVREDSDEELPTVLPDWDSSDEYE